MENWKSLLKRHPVDEDYFSLLGLSVYVFSSMEWNAAYCCERMENGYVSLVSNPKEKVTGFNIAEKLISLAKKLNSSSDKDALLTAAEQFMVLVREERNYLFHAHPAHINGKNMLTKAGKEFDADALEKYVQRCFECSGVLNKSLYGFLKD